MASTPLERFRAANHDGPPAYLGRRFDRDGKFQPEIGNTVVCHLVEGSPSAAAVIASRSRLLAFAPPGQLAFTPPESLHMTLFEGVIENRRTPGHWPEGHKLDADIAGMTAHYLQRLEAFEGCGAFEVAVSGVTPNGLQLAGASDRDDAVLRAWREALTVPFGYRHPQHDDYRFHMTFAYVIRWLEDEELPAWQQMLEAELAILQREAPVLELRLPAFCRFADMTRFEELLVLG